MPKFAVMTAVETLKKYWGYDAFRPMQGEIIDTALQGKDVLAILPTGGGKSVCFQVPVMMQEGLGLVVTPLIALMKDQVQNLNDRGIKAIAVHSGMNRKEVDLALNNAAYGGVKFLYVSPERLGTRLFLSYLEVLKINRIIVDEAHCISQWGYDFRPDYLKISEIRKICPAPLMALTATATPKVAGDIMDRLTRPGTPSEMERNREAFVLLKSGFERPNLSYIVRKSEDKSGMLLNICRGVAGSGIVYMRNRKKCEETAALLESGGISASYYHAGLDPLTRETRQQDWKSGKIRVMVCTNAFGMGIDKPDVRFVVHLGFCDSPEAYFQEAGRAGRDGLRSYAVLVWNDRDVQRAEQILTLSFPELDYIEDIYQKIHIFNNIIYEAGEGFQFNFDPVAFAKHYALNSAQLRYALRYLELSDHLSYDEDAVSDTRVKILVPRNQLYEIELPDEPSKDLLEALMRGYPGIFSFAVGVDERSLAAGLGVGIPRLRQLLYGLSVEHVIKYIPSSSGPVINLHHNRLMPGNLDLKKDLYEFLKRNARERSEAVREYALQTELCRSRYLLAYFGQSESGDCGHCDLCLERKQLKKKLLAFAQTHPGFSLDDLKAWCDDPANGMSREAISLYRRMLDEGEIV